MVQMRLAEWFSRSVGFPLIIHSPWRRRKDRRGFGRLVREKIASQYLSPEQREAAQLGRLHDLLRHAGQRVPYYRELFRAIGFDPRDVRRLADLQTLPPLSRKTVREQGRRMLAEAAKARGLTSTQTSGTTGVPLDFWRDPNCDRHLEAAAWMSDMAAGRSIGAPTAYLWGWTPPPSALQRLLDGARSRLRNERRYNSRTMTPGFLRQFHRANQAHPPDVLVAYPSGLARLARLLQADGLVPNFPRKALIPTGEVLEPDVRAAIERVFAAPIFNRYGSREVGLMAFECDEHLGLHVNTANLILECSGPEVYDEPGELLITHLYNYAMPLIRYQVDDQAVLEPGPCGCGRTTPRLARVVGRKMPPFINPAGAAVEPYFLISRVRAMDNVVEFQLIQHDRYHLQLLVVAGQGCTHDQFAEARDVIARYMGAECELRIDFVDSLPRPDSGKLQMLVSHLAAEG